MEALKIARYPKEGGTAALLEAFMERSVANSDHVQALEAQLRAHEVQLTALRRRIKHVSPGMEGMPQDQREKYVDCACGSCPSFLAVDNDTEDVCSTCLNLGC